MRTLCLSLAVLPCALACGGSGTTMPDGGSGATTISITTGQPAALVAFRDGVDGSWQAAVTKTTTTFEAQVHGPYVVAVVCNDMFTTTGGTFESLDTFQAGRTLDDPHSFGLCQPTMTTSTVTGHMVQAGTVVLGSAFDTSANANWNFKLAAVNGTYDLIATTSAGVLIQRGLAITGNLAIAQSIDVTQGAAFTTAAFTVTNATASETLRAATFLETPANSLAATLYNGAPATAKVLPDTALRDTDRQTVSLRATTTTSAGTATRALRRPFRVGGDTGYMLPAALGNPQWTVAGLQAQVSWTQLSVAGNLTEMISGMASGGKAASYELDLTASFVAATAPTQAIIDTNIPSYKAEWRIDLAMAYNRQLTIQRITDGIVTSLSIDETIAP